MSSLLETVNAKTGERRYFINGRRVTRDRLEMEKFGRRLECLHTVSRGNLTRHYSETSTTA